MEPPSSAGAYPEASRPAGRVSLDVYIHMIHHRIIFKKIAGHCFRWKFSREQGVPMARIILMYHRVVREPPALGCPAGMYVTAATLRSNLLELVDSFDVVPLARLIDPEPSERPLCALTFDDGWRDNYEVAFPLLREVKVPATIFLPVAMIDTGCRLWFSRLWELAEKTLAGGVSPAFVRYFRKRVPGWTQSDMGEAGLSALILAMLNLNGGYIEEIVNDAFRELAVEEDKKRQLLSWEEVTCMSRSGISFGSHGQRHYTLSTLAKREKEEEIGGSLAFLREKNINSTPFFCFPNGRWDQEALAMLEEAGYQGGVTTELGCNIGVGNPLLLERIRVHDHIVSAPSLLWFRLLQAGLAQSLKVSRLLPGA
jgi:peptidoglycan/xylan/chitin deacetylase (PgdA/CDA1 family)